MREEQMSIFEPVQPVVSADEDDEPDPEEPTVPPGDGAPPYHDPTDHCLPVIEKSDRARRVESAFQEAMTALDAGGFAGTVISAFDKMEIAERLIDEMQQRYPDAAGALDNSFEYTTPSPALPRESEELYAGHVREILRRVGQAESSEHACEDADLRAPTDAEVLAALAEVSQAVPLSRYAHALYMTLFGRVYGEQFCREHGLWSNVEQVLGRYDDSYSERRMSTLRQQVADKLRPRLPPRSCHE
jgi:hypothetical protein